MLGFNDIDKRFSHNDKLIYILGETIIPCRLILSNKIEPIIRNKRIDDIKVMWI